VYDGRKELVTIGSKLLGSAAPVAVLLFAAFAAEEPGGPPPPEPFVWSAWARIVPLASAWATT
jgi:hypothetical protein